MASISIVARLHARGGNAEVRGDDAAVVRAERAFDFHVDDVARLIDGRESDVVQCGE